MELEEKNASPGYGKPPWIFKGSALYQLHLVKAETARAFIPKEFRLVEVFGYTLGGFFLASYDDSPAGSFDELVVIAGIVWNPPTSCAWAARVLVNSEEACIHGRKEVGLPSQVAKFSKKMTAISETQKSRQNGFLNMLGISTLPSSPKSGMDVEIDEINGQAARNICNINLCDSVPQSISSKWMGPLIRMSLPSFSGRTKHNPHLLKYSCHVECRIRTVRAAKVSVLSAPDMENNGSFILEDLNEGPRAGEVEVKKKDLCVAVMLSKPVVALEFNCLKMKVEAPKIVAECSDSLTTC